MFNQLLLCGIIGMTVVRYRLPEKELKIDFNDTKVLSSSYTHVNFVLFDYLYQEIIDRNRKVKHETTTFYWRRLLIKSSL